MTNMNQNGRSMIEMLGVLAIIGVLSVGGIAGYSKAMLKFKTNKTIDQIAMTVTNIRTLYAQQPNYDIKTADALSMGVVDDAMDGGEVNNKQTLKNAFNGPVFIESAKSGAIGEDGTGAFVITFAGLPREACVNIATNDWGSNYSSGLLGIGAGVGANKADVAKAQDIACYVANKTSAAAITTGDTIEDMGSKGQKACAADNNGPLSVASAATGCDCADNNCFVTFKYY